MKRKLTAAALMIVLSSCCVLIHGVFQPDSKKTLAMYRSAISEFYLTASILHQALDRLQQGDNSSLAPGLYDETVEAFEALKQEAASLAVVVDDTEVNLDERIAELPGWEDTRKTIESLIDWIDAFPFDTRLSEAIERDSDSCRVKSTDKLNVIRHQFGEKLGWESKTDRIEVPALKEKRIVGAGDPVDGKSLKTLSNQSLNSELSKWSSGHKGSQRTSAHIESDHPLILEKAMELGWEPLQIYNYVRNAIQYEPYPGQRKRPSALVQGGKANEWDASVLLVSLLRASGVTCSLVQADVEIPIDTALKCLGMPIEDDATEARRKELANKASSRLNSLYGTGHTSVIVTEDKTTGLRLNDYGFVVANIDYVPSRGVKRAAFTPPVPTPVFNTPGPDWEPPTPLSAYPTPSYSGNTWIPLDVVMKPMDVHVAEEGNPLARPDFPLLATVMEERFLISKEIGDPVEGLLDQFMSYLSDHKSGETSALFQHCNGAKARYEENEYLANTLPYEIIVTGTPPPLVYIQNEDAFFDDPAIAKARTLYVMVSTKETSVPAVVPPAASLPCVTLDIADCANRRVTFRFVPVDPVPDGIDSIYELVPGSISLRPQILLDGVVQPWSINLVADVSLGAEYYLYFVLTDSTGMDPVVIENTMLAGEFFNIAISGQAIDDATDLQIVDRFNSELMREGGAVTKIDPETKQFNEELLGTYLQLQGRHYFKQLQYSEEILMGMSRGRMIRDTGIARIGFTFNTQFSDHVPVRISAFASFCDMDHYPSNFEFDETPFRFTHDDIRKFQGMAMSAAESELFFRETGSMDAVVSTAEIHRRATAAGDQIRKITEYINPNNTEEFKDNKFREEIIATLNHYTTLKYTVYIPHNSYTFTGSGTSWTGTGYIVENGDAKGYMILGRLEDSKSGPGVVKESSGGFGLAGTPMFFDNVFGFETEAVIMQQTNLCRSEGVFGKYWEDEFYHWVTLGIAKQFRWRLRTYSFKTHNFRFLCAEPSCMMGRMWLRVLFWNGCGALDDIPDHLVAVFRDDKSPIECINLYNKEYDPIYGLYPYAKRPTPRPISEEMSIKWFEYDPYLGRGYPSNLPSWNWDFGIPYFYSSLWFGGFFGGNTASSTLASSLNLKVWHEPFYVSPGPTSTHVPSATPTPPTATPVPTQQPGSPTWSPSPNPTVTPTFTSTPSNPSPTPTPKGRVHCDGFLADYGHPLTEPPDYEEKLAFSKEITRGGTSIRDAGFAHVPTCIPLNWETSGPEGDLGSKLFGANFREDDHFLNWGFDTNYDVEVPDYWVHLRDTPWGCECHNVRGEVSYCPEPTATPATGRCPMSDVTIRIEQNKPSGGWIYLKTTRTRLEPDDESGDMKAVFHCTLPGEGYYRFTPIKYDNAGLITHVICGSTEAEPGCEIVAVTEMNLYKPILINEMVMCPVADPCNTSPDSMFNQRDFVPPHFQPEGMQPGRTYYSGLGGEQIDLFSGTMDLAVGFATLPGDGGFDFTIALHHNSRLYLDQSVGPWETWARQGQFGVGWELGLGKVILRSGSLPVIFGMDGSYRVAYCTDTDYTMGPYVTEDGWILTFEGGDSPTDENVKATVITDTGVTYKFQTMCKNPRGVCPFDDCTDYTYTWLVDSIKPAFAAQNALISVEYTTYQDTMEYVIDGETHEAVREFYTIDRIMHAFGSKPNSITFESDSWFDNKDEFDPPPTTSELILNGTVIARFEYSDAAEHHRLLETITRPADTKDVSLVDRFEYYTENNQAGDPISKLIKRHILPEGGAFEYIYKTETPQNRKYRAGGEIKQIVESNATLNVIKATDGSKSEEMTGSMVFTFVESPADGMMATVESHEAFEPSPENLLRTERYRFKSVASGASEREMGLLTSYELIRPDQDPTVAIQTTYDSYDIRDLCQFPIHPCMTDNPGIRLLETTTSTEFKDAAQTPPPGVTVENMTINTSIVYQTSDAISPWTTTNPELIERKQEGTLLSRVSYTWENGYLGENLLRLMKTQSVAREGASQVDTSYLYDDVRIGLPKKISAENLNTIIEYDTLGNAKKVTNPDETFVEYLWWQSSDLTVRLADGKRTNVTFGSVYRKPSNVVDLNDASTTLTYDSIGRPLSVRPPVGGEITYNYQSPRDNKATQSGMWMSQSVDGFGRPVSTKYTADIGDGGMGRNVMRQDAFGRMKYASVPLAGESNKTDEGFWVNQAFDVMGRPLRSKDPAGNVISVAYQPGWVFQTDGNSNMTMNKLDGNGRIVEVRLPVNGDHFSETYYDYDLLGNLKHVMQYDRETGWQERFFEYDNLGRVTRETHPETGDTYYAYDPVTGRMTGTEAHDGSTREISEYDNLGRIKIVNFASQTTSGIQTLQIKQHYDGAGLTGVIPGANLEGKLTALETYTNGGTTPETWLAWPDFDDLGRNREKVLTVDDPDDPVTLRLRYEYETEDDELGRLVQVKYYDGADDSALLGSVHYVYREGQDSLKSVTFQPAQGDSINLLNKIVHHVTGSVSTMERGNGVLSEFEYDSAWRTDSIVHQKGTGGGSEPLFESSGYQYDQVHNIKGIDETCLGRRDQYVYNYDQWDRLSGVTGNIAGIEREEGFDYDSTGNMTHQTRTIAGVDQFDREYQYGSDRGVLVFGGTDGTTGLGDTWMLKKEADQWEAIEGGGPSARSDAAMVYDPYLDQTVLFGGVNQAGDVQGDTWVYEDGQWRNVVLASGPEARHGHEMVYHKGMRRIVMLGGVKADETAANDMWIWRGSRWEEVPGVHPLNRTEFGAAALGANGIMVFGGKVEGDATKECWIWREGAWATCDVPDTMEARYGHAMTWDTSADRVVLVGGRDADNDDMAETWEYVADTWYPVNSDSAAARTGASLVYDPDREAVVMFGGGGATGLKNTLWILNVDEWTEIGLANQPIARRNQSMTYLASRTANRPDSGSTQMGKGSSWSNRYDGRGNRVADAEFEYQYNGADRLVTISDKETKQELMRSVYDGTGKRVKVSEPGGPTMWTMYDGEVPIIERSEDGSIALHVYADGLHIARLTMPGSKDATDDPPGVEYYHSDHLGSPRLMTDQEGDVVWPTVKAASYWAYGGVMEDLAGDTEANRWRFTGKPEDETTGHHYFNARYLSESTKYNAPQFMSPDPVLGNVADPRSWNRYAYCLGNPINSTDPDGLLTIFVHGTWSNPTECWNDDFRSVVLETLADNAFVDIDWSNRKKNNNSIEREKGANRLLQEILKVPEGEPINIVTHSHGGNVGFLASQMLADENLKTGQNIQISNFIAISPPIRDEYQPDMSVIGALNVVSNVWDGVQVNGGSNYSADIATYLFMAGTGRLFRSEEIGSAGRALNIPGVNNILLNEKMLSECGLGCMNVSRGHGFVKEAPSENNGIWKEYVVPQLRIIPPN